MPLLSTKLDEIKYFKLAEAFRVNREFSKKHGVLAVFLNPLKTYLIYSVKEDGSLNPVYS